MISREEFILKYQDRAKRYAFKVFSQYIYWHPDEKDDIASWATIELIQSYDSMCNDPEMDEDMLLGYALTNVKYRLKGHMAEERHGTYIPAGSKVSGIVKAYKEGLTITEIMEKYKCSKYMVTIAIQRSGQASLDGSINNDDEDYNLMNRVSDPSSIFGNNSYSEIEVLESIIKGCEDEIDHKIVRYRQMGFTIIECAKMVNLKREEVNRRLTMIFLKFLPYVNNRSRRRIRATLNNQEDEWDRIIDSFRLNRITLNDIAGELEIPLHEVISICEEFSSDPEAKTITPMRGKLKRLVLECKIKIGHTPNKLK